MGADTSEGRAFPASPPGAEAWKGGILTAPETLPEAPLSVDVLGTSSRYGTSRCHGHCPGVLCVMVLLFPFLGPDSPTVLCIQMLFPSLLLVTESLRFWETNGGISVHCLRLCVCQSGCGNWAGNTKALSFRWPPASRSEFPPCPWFQLASREQVRQLRAASAASSGDCSAEKSIYCQFLTVFVNN